MSRTLIILLIHAFFLNVPAQQIWHKHPNNPVILDAPFAVVGMSDPTLYFDGSIYHLWISGGGFVPDNPTPSVRTGYYTSTNFLNWIPALDNPVLREDPPGTWDSGHIETPHVLKDDLMFRLYYCATPDSAPDDPETLQFGLATSPDGSSWTRHTDNPLLNRGNPEDWDGRWIESPCVLKLDNQYFMWYNGIDMGWRIHIGLATSEDGIHWTKHAENPVLSPDPEIEWRSIAMYAPQVRKIEGRFLMLYTGLKLGETTYDFQNMKTGLAVSQDGIHWETSGTSVLEGTADAWDAPGPFTLDWIEDGDSLRLFYTSDGLGTAVSSKIPAGILDRPCQGPEEFVTLSAYPNPFNSQTCIVCQLNEPALIHLDIIDLRGRNVRTFRLGPRAAGNFRVFWNGFSEDGESCGNGLYILRLTAGEKLVTQRIVLLK